MQRMRKGKYLKLATGKLSFNVGKKIIANDLSGTVMKIVYYPGKTDPEYTRLTVMTSDHEVLVDKIVGDKMAILYPKNTETDGPFHIVGSLSVEILEAGNNAEIENVIITLRD